MSNILLIEPDYKNKYPPLGLMKISYFHKHVLGDHVRFTKGRLPAALAEAKWDRVYVTSLFTFEWAKTIEAIQYAKTLVDSIDKITVGGIAATMLPQQIYEETGIRPVCGLLNEPGKLGLPGDECIDQIVPDYAILDDIDYVYPFHDAYFLSATKGCGNKCGFCAVQTLEPQYIPYIDLKQRIAAIEEEFGSKRDLLLMDNNVLRSPNFDQIIDDIIAAGFGKGATYLNPKTGKRVRRYVDFNQGLDALFFTEEKARRLGEIALRPARVAFDHIEDLPTYERALRLCAKHGITELSNYVLYNSEAFGGKGQQYAADTPADLYNRMRLTLDIKDDINRSLPEDRQVTAFSFPMRYIPLTAHERGYVGSQWNAKFLRAVQCMLIPTQGKGVGSRSFFEADFGKNAEEFVRFLCMPDKLIAARGEFSLSSRGRGGEDPEALAARKAVWEKNQRKIREWNRLYQQLGDERTQFIALIGDNEFLPEKLLGAPSDLQKKLYLLYLTIPRTLALLGMVRSGSPTYDMLKGYICSEFPDLYQDMVELLSTSEAQQQYMFQNFTQFFGRDGLADLLSALAPQDFRADRLLKKWHDACVKSGMGLVDFELIRVYTRYLDAEVLSPEERAAARRAILELDMPALAVLLSQRSGDFEAAVLASVAGEAGQELLNTTAQAIFRNIQCKLSQLLEA
ncbi:hypothetical protein [Pseudoflavonifractor phocaeensis]|uniref:hypothetical protein n=1 Tax=Pseudoflavonifractor phocaeensis TaxID=1870988 RepID=UPI00195DEFB1|nr:hypothetical protein [Pseudoflavonifractor phocaeensis]MBM6885584.1 hypothetical protein [Pseudoflavonifractor phocaeensis]